LHHYLCTGPRLPRPVYAAKMVSTPSGKGVILIGGNNVTGAGGYHAYLIELICDAMACEWVEMEQKLQVPRDDFVAMLIPDTLTNCTKET
jgi:hypothetical protein